jgi:hypothetical protein
VSLEVIWVRNLDHGHLDSGTCIFGPSVPERGGVGIPKKWGLVYYACFRSCVMGTTVGGMNVGLVVTYGLKSTYTAVRWMVSCEGERNSL